MIVVEDDGSRWLSLDEPISPSELEQATQEAKRSFGAYMSTTDLWKALEQVLRVKGASDDWLDYAMPDLHIAAAQFGFSCWGDGYLACERGDPMPNRQEAKP